MSRNSSYILCKPKSCSYCTNKSACFCPPTELVRNGGFEEAGVEDLFVYWQFTGTTTRLNDSIVKNDGKRAAAIVSEGSAGVTNKIGRLYQNVPVTPGCLLQLSYADNFFTEGTTFGSLNIIARVFYGEVFSPSTQVELLRLETEYQSVEVGTGFRFHSKIADVPVPCNIPFVTVDFTFIARDLGTPNSTSWLLDSVSLRAVSPECSC